MTDLTRGFGLLLVCLILVSEVARSEEGSLIITGSDTMAGVLSEWAGDFRSLRAGVTIEIQASGSATAPTALAEGTANIGAMTRLMSSVEIADFLRRQGHLPTPVPVGRDALALIVHPENPLRSLSMPAIDRIFSANSLCQGGSRLRSWRRLLEETVSLSDGESQAFDAGIQVYGRTAVSGSYGFFQQYALCGGDFAADVGELPGFAAIVDAVATIPGAVGYVGLGFVDSRVRTVAVMAPSGEDVDVNQQGYPLARYLYLYLAAAPDQRGASLECEFLRYTRTARAQDVLLSHGFQPITESSADTVGMAEGLIDVCP